MATTKKTSSTSFATELQTLINGLTNNMPSGTKSMNVGGSSLTIVQVVAQLTTALALITAVTQTKAAYAAAVAAKKAGLAAARVLYENVVANLKQMFGLTNQTQLAAFGINAPKARAKPTSETKAIAHAKALATRQARGTKGSKQKLAVTTTTQPTLQVLIPNGSSSSTPSSTQAAPVAPAASTRSPAEAPAAPAAPAATPAPTH